MAPVKKQKAIKLTKVNEKQVEKEQNGESVVSGQLKKKINKKKQKPQRDPKGVLFIKHLPHGFFEEQLKKYFEQFGTVTRLRLVRSRRTGNSKGFAFVEFEYPEVAEVAAVTMNNYLMFKKIIKASYIPPEKQQFNYFRTSIKKIRNKSGKLVWVSGKTASIQQKAKTHNDWSKEKYQKRTQKQLKKLKKMGEKYAHLGFDINELIMEPKVVTEKVKYIVNETKEEKAACSSKSIIRKASRKDIPLNKQKNSKKLENQVSLEDLLGSTIQDTEDEDYTAMTDSEHDAEESEESSDEESYGFAKDSDLEDDKEQDDSDNESAEEIQSVIQKKSKKNFGKILKASNVERFDKLLKRKTHTGGINKFNKKPLNQAPVVTKRKRVLQITAAKELAKPLSKVNEKLSKPLKAKKKLIKVK